MSCCCVRGRRVFLNPVTNGDLTTKVLSLESFVLDGNFMIICSYSTNNLPGKAVWACT